MKIKRGDMKTLMNRPKIYRKLLNPVTKTFQRLSCMLEHPSTMVSTEPAILYEYR